jgi:hypothetical protein
MLEGRNVSLVPSCAKELIPQLGPTFDSPQDPILYALPRGVDKNFSETRVV